ncbi:MAG: hypothetical protein VYC34_02720 [Planctomycetota bacterium]|nr:hypothetical protein [Planctomycetota bacterium]
MNTEATDSRPADPAAPAESTFEPSAPAHGLDVGPRIALPTFTLLAAPIAAAAVIGLVGWLIVRGLHPAAAPVVWQAAAGVAASFTISILLLRPWKPRHLGRWPLAWLGQSGVAFLITLACAGGLLYSASPGEHLSLGLVLAAGHFGALMAEVAVFARCFRPYRA